MAGLQVGVASVVALSCEIVLPPSTGPACHGICTPQTDYMQLVTAEMQERFDTLN